MENQPIVSSEILDCALTNFDLSVRALSCLEGTSVRTLRDLVSHNKNDLLKFRNIGKVSLLEFDTLVSSKGLRFGMTLNDIEIFYRKEREREEKENLLRQDVCNFVSPELAKLLHEANIKTLKELVSLKTYELPSRFQDNEEIMDELNKAVKDNGFFWGM